MPTAFGVTPSWLDGDDPLPEGLDPSAMPAQENDPNSRVQLLLGNDNPFFDFRRPGDPGGVGFYRLYSQVQLLETGRAFLSLGLQAVTPAGLESEGLQEGPTFVSPNFAWSYELSDGTAMHAFVGKNLRANSRWHSGLHRHIDYGLAMQSPCLPGVLTDPVDPRLHVFVEALGRYRYDGANNPTPAKVEIVPGLHWQPQQNWWLSGGLLLPMDGWHTNCRLWQLTCSWQF